MATLPSGLDATVGDDEVLVRFLTSSKWFNTLGAKWQAFSPYPEETSVYRRDNLNDSELQLLGKENIPGAKIYGAAIIVSAKVRRIGSLLVESEEPPRRHAAIRGWPVIHDKEAEKRERISFAQQLASQSDKIDF